MSSDDPIGIDPASITSLRVDCAAGWAMAGISPNSTFVDGMDVLLQQADTGIDKYFHGRPSATLAPDPADSTKTVPAPYNAANSGGSNLGPTNKALNDRVKEDVDKLKAENPSAAVPIDLVTTSGSGLDPDISPEGALFQVPRVAKARNMPEDRVRALVAEYTKGRFAGLFGEPRVNVLALNLALDRRHRK